MVQPQHKFVTFRMTYKEWWMMKREAKKYETKTSGFVKMLWAEYKKVKGLGDEKPNLYTSVMFPESNV